VRHGFRDKWLRIGPVRSKPRSRISACFPGHASRAARLVLAVSFHNRHRPVRYGTQRDAFAGRSDLTSPRPVQDRCPARSRRVPAGAPGQVNIRRPIPAVRADVNGPAGFRSRWPVLQAIDQQFVEDSASGTVSASAMRSDQSMSIRTSMAADAFSAAATDCATAGTISHRCNSASEPVPEVRAPGR